MAIAIRDVREHELDSVLAINNAAGRTISALDPTRLRAFYRAACRFRVAEIDGALAGFLIALREDADLPNLDLIWLREHYASFVHIERIVIADRYRRHGLGRVLYADVTSYAEVRVPVLTCQVRLEPRDDVSLLFHGTSGFHEVGQLGRGDNAVAVLAKPLDSFAFVRETYLDGGIRHLPDVPWLAERERGGAEVTRMRAAGGA
jgi:predicted GNAT superfamily acetyltransferase